MARVGAILTFLISVALLVGAGFAVSKDQIRAAEICGLLGVILLLTSIVLFLLKKPKRKDGGVPPKTAKTAPKKKA